MFLGIWFYVLFHIPIVRADGWDDFSNNLATDLAPFLSLFGEQITKQYLSESITLLDNFIFAMAPMGILTAVVSAIRVCGSPSLRAFIGRAQEGKGNAEAELCSSTSRDVCELYNNGGIARVFGRPKIIEIVYVPDDREFKNTAGIYTFKEYLKSSRGGEEWAPKHKMDPESSESVAPNLSLNVGIKRRPRFAFWAVATIGFILQAGVLVFAIFTTYVLQWDKDGNRPDSYACPLAVTGTIMVCAGCFLCAFLVGQSTNERSFRRRSKTKVTKKPSSIYWVQPGGQTLGDQIFDPFCYSDHSRPLDEYITSWKNTSQNWTKTSGLMVWAAVGTIISGFILQFVGLRGIHSAISVSQLGAVMAMSAARAALRMQRLRAEDNYLLDRPDEVVGHELDWLALQIGERETCSKDRLFWRFYGSKGIEKSCPATSSNSSMFCSPKEAQEGGVPTFSDLDMAAKLLLYRTRLAELTQSQTSQTKAAGAAAHFEVEMVEARQRAVGLSQAMESALNTIYSRVYDVQEEWETATSMYWSFSCNAGSPALNTLSLKLSRERLGSPWILQNKQQLEGILGLWVWSLTADDAVEILDQQSKLVLSRANDIPARRIITTNEYIPESDLKIWFGSMAPEILEDELCVDSIDYCSASTIWEQDSQRVRESELDQKLVLCTTYKNLSGKLPPYAMEDVVRFVGWPAAEPSQSQSPKKLKCRSAPTNTSLLSLCAQEIFGSFIKDILNLVSDFGVTRAATETEHFRPESALASDLTNLFIDNNLGSKRDASLCILPPLIPHLVRSSTRDTLVVAKKSADQYRKVGEWHQAEGVLKWAWRQCRNYSLFEYSSESSSEVPLRNDHSQAAAIALFELYRWALRDGKKRGFGYSGIEWLAGQHPPVATRETVDRYVYIANCIDGSSVGRDGDHRSSSSPVGRDLTNTLLHVTRSDPPKMEEGKELLCSAARLNWVEVVLALCELGTAPDFEDSESRTALSYAAENGNADLVKALMSVGALPNSTDGKHRTPLSYAAEVGRNDVVEVLLNDQLLDLNHKDNDGRTPLAIAAAKGHYKTVQMLLDTGKARPNVEDNDAQTPLSQAIYAGHQKIVQVLLKKGADINWTNGQGMTCLARASSGGQTDVVQRLLENGANIKLDDQNGRTPLFWAATNGHVATVELLLKYDADIYAADYHGVYPFGAADTGGHVSVVKLLLDKAGATDPDRYSSKSLLWGAVRGNHVIIVDQLLKYGANIELKNHEGQTPLYVAVDFGNEAMVELLLDKGACIRSPSGSGETPWSLAMAQNNSNVLRLFRDKYPDL